jgi:hypothetical protein
MANEIHHELEREIPAVENLLRQGPITMKDGARAVHGPGAIGRFNDRFALLVTNSVGTMWCAYVFALIALVSLPSAIEELPGQGPQPLISWIAQTFLQLVLLSIIMVGQRVQQEASDQRAAADHQILGALQTINQVQLEILRRLEGNPTTSTKCGPDAA